MFGNSLVRKVADGYEVIQGHMRLRATLDVSGNAEVVDAESGAALRVHEIAGRLVVLTVDAQRTVEQAADDVITKAAHGIPRN